MRNQTIKKYAKVLTVINEHLLLGHSINITETLKLHHCNTGLPSLLVNAGYWKRVKKGVYVSKYNALITEDDVKIICGIETTPLEINTESVESPVSNPTPVKKKRKRKPKHGLVRRLWFGMIKRVSGFLTWIW